MRSLLSALLLTSLSWLGSCHGLGNSAARDPMLVHSVYFTLREDTPAKRAALIASAKKNLAPIAGIVHFAVGERDEGLVRDVNDKDFDVALLVVFYDRASHDRYQPDARHQAFIAEGKDNWATVRVFDSLVQERVSP